MVWLAARAAQALGACALQLARCSHPAPERTRRKAEHWQLSEPRAGNRPCQAPTATGTRATAAELRSPRGAGAGCHVNFPPPRLERHFFYCFKGIHRLAVTGPSTTPFPPLQGMHRGCGAVSASEKVLSSL